MWATPRGTWRRAPAADCALTARCWMICPPSVLSQRYRCHWVFHSVVSVSSCPSDPLVLTPPPNKATPLPWPQSHTVPLENTGAPGRCACVVSSRRTVFNKLVHSVGRYALNRVLRSLSLCQVGRPNCNLALSSRGEILRSFTGLEVVCTELAYTERLSCTAPR